MGRIPSTLPDTAKQISARGSHGTLRLITEWCGRIRYVLSYTMTIENHSSQPIKLLGRHWEIAWGNTREPMSFRSDQFAPSVAGGHPVLYPGRSFSYEAGLVVDGPETPTLSGLLEAVEIRTGRTIRIQVEKFTFGDDSTPDLISGEGLLTASGAERMMEAVEAFNFLSRTEGGAIFRADKIGDLGSDDILLINRYLFEFFRKEKQKVTRIDFSPIMPDGRACEITSTDHFMERTSETIYNSRNALYLSYAIINDGISLKSRNPPDSELASDLASLIDKWGFDAVQKELLQADPLDERLALARRAVPECDDIFVAVLEAKREFNERRHSFSRPPLPSLSPRDLIEIANIAKKYPWSERKNDRRTPFEWVRDYYSKWVGKGILQKHLKADPDLYAAFAKSSKRLGLPEWLDVPTEGDAFMRRLVDPDQQFKALVTRHIYSAIQKSIAR